MIDIYCDDEDCEGKCRVVGVLNVKEDGKSEELIREIYRICSRPEMMFSR